MSYQAHLTRMRKLLRQKPAMSAPPLRSETPADLHDSKDEQRAYDQARLDLKLVTTQELQRQNSAVKIDPKRPPRVIRFAQYV